MQGENPLVVDSIILWRKEDERKNRNCTLNNCFDGRHL